MSVARPAASRLRQRRPGRERGAVLLAVMLVFITAAAYFLLEDLNAATRQAAREQQTAAALSMAKQGLIAYAVTYPDRVNADSGPGYLPCPDRNNNGSADDGACADDTLPFPTTVGRLPWRTLGLNELHDGDEERLWYVVSQQHRHNPKLIPLYSETPGTLTLDGVNDIVALVIAPGSPVANQSTRDSDPELATNYLEGANVDGDRDFVSAAAGDFNDRVLAITRSELMAAVERRVLNEVATVLERYRTTRGAYPWLAPFADPKLPPFVVAGLVKQDAAAPPFTLVADPGTNFLSKGLIAGATGDVVYNVTDGSFGRIASVVDNTTLTLTSLVGGALNELRENDVFLIKPQGAPAVLSGMAGSGSTGLELEDPTRNFRALGIYPGAVVENVADGSAGLIASVRNSVLVVRRLTGGVTNAFSPGQAYRIRSNTGSAGSGSGFKTLVDANGTDLVALGVAPGDMLENASSGAQGVVATVGVPTVSTLTVVEVLGGDDIASPGDGYRLSRFEGQAGTRVGHLPIHDLGEAFRTAFSPAWNLPAASNNVVLAPSAFFSPNPPYVAGLGNVVVNSEPSSPDGSSTVIVPDTNASCLWLSKQFADCLGTWKKIVLTGIATGGDADSLTDTATDWSVWGVSVGDIVQNLDALPAPAMNGTAGAGSGGTSLVDSNADFVTAGVRAGAYLVENTTLGLRGIVETVEPIRMNVAPIPGQPAPEFNDGDNYEVFEIPGAVVTSVDEGLHTLSFVSASGSVAFSAGDLYRVRQASALETGTATSGMPIGSFGLLCDATKDFLTLGVKVGDAIRAPVADATGVVYGIPSSTCVMAHWFENSVATYPGTDFSIWHHYVYERHYALHARFAGTVRVHDSTPGDKRRDVCLGYDTQCGGTPVNVSLIHQPEPTVTIHDVDEMGDVVGSASVSIGPTGTAQGYLRVQDIRYELADELPSWLTANRWHELILVGYAPLENPPGGTSPCLRGTSCIEVLPDGAPPQNDNKRAVVVIAGGQELPGQDRTNGTAGDYFEEFNEANGGQYFSRRAAMPASRFDDQLRAVSTVP